MFFDGEEGEGDFGPPPGKSKLSSLFGMDKANNQGGNESLTYTAPKQPKKGAKGSRGTEGATPAASSGAGQSALLLAVAVHAYRFSNGTYIKHGKLGAAILGNHTANDYKLLLYISKQQQVTHARVAPHFIFTTQANNYATFYDEQRQNWSIMFETEQNGIDFAKQVGLCKLNAAGGITKGVIQQDLTVGVGDTVSEGDSVEVKYTGWLYQNRAFGTVFDSNANVDKAFRFKIGRGKVIKGWEEGVISMKKGGRRLLLIPPALAYGKKGLGSRIPANSTLIFDVEVKKIKISKDETGSVSSDVMEAASLGANDTHRAASPRVDGTSDFEEPVRIRSPSTASLTIAPKPDRKVSFGEPARIRSPSAASLSKAPKPDRKISFGEPARIRSPSAASLSKAPKPDRKISFGEPARIRSPSAASLSKAPKPDRKISSDETVKTRSASINEQLSTSPATSSKAKLISRMARMGQPMLPLQGATIAAESTDESEADENSASDTGYPSPPPVTAQPHPRSKPAKTARKPPTSAKPEHAVPDGMATAHAGIQQQQMHMANMPTTTQAMPHTHTVAVYQPQPQQQQFQPQMQPQQQPMGMQGIPAMGQQAAFQSTSMHGTAQQYPMQQFAQQTTDPNLLFQQQQQQQAAAVVAAQQTLQQQQHFGASLLGGTSQALVQPVSKELPVLLSESRQHHSDLKMVMDLVSGKIDNLSSRVEKLNFQSSGMGQTAANTPTLEANILMQNIARIVQENEKLKKENTEKGNKIEAQNDKIADLLQRNQMFVEQSNTMMEKRNDSFKQTTAQSQARVLELEQEKVQLTTDLSNATAKISSIQMELSGVQQREGQLKGQLNLGMNTTQSHLSEMEAMRARLQEADWKVTELTRSLKEEKAEKKTLNNRFLIIEEELNDIKSEKETIDKSLSERKRKAASEKQRFEDEMEDLKKQYEEEISNLQNKLRLQKSTKDVATAEQIAHVERELEVQWRERSERLLAQATDKHDRMYGELNGEKDALAQKLAQTEQKMIALRSGQGEMREEENRLKEQLSEMGSWKEKYDGLHSNAVSMKERYEERIKEMIQDRETREGAASHSNIIDEVKKIMNSVYHTLRSEFEPGSSYKGADILNSIMNTIKLVTLKLAKRSAGGSTEEEDEEEDEDSEEEEEEEEEDSEEESEEEETPAVQPSKQSSTRPQPPVKEAVQSSAPPPKEAPPPSEAPPSPEATPPTPPSQTPPPAVLPPGQDEPDEIPDLPDIPAEAQSEPEHGSDTKDNEEISAAVETSELQNDSQDFEGDLPVPSKDEIQDEEGPTSPPPELPPEIPPEEPPSDENEENEQSEEEEDFKEPEPNKEVPDQELTTEEVPQVPIASDSPHDSFDDLPEFNPTDTAPDVTNDTAPDVTNDVTAPPEGDKRTSASPPPFLPSLPPELPPEDEERPRTKSAADDIFGDDEDEDEFFSTPPTKRKELVKKMSMTKPVVSTESNENDSLKPQSPPPLFGSEDDDDDDLDWLNTKK